MKQKEGRKCWRWHFKDGEKVWHQNKRNHLLIKLEITFNKKGMISISSLSSSWHPKKDLSRLPSNKFISSLAPDKTWKYQVNLHFLKWFCNSSLLPEAPFPAAGKAILSWRFSNLQDLCSTSAPAALKASKRWKRLDKAQTKIMANYIRKREITVHSCTEVE